MSIPSKSTKPRKAAPKVKAVEAWALLVKGRISHGLMFSRLKEGLEWCELQGRPTTFQRVTIAPAKPRAKRKNPEVLMCHAPRAKRRKGAGK